MENKAVFMTGINSMETRTVDIPEIKENEVLVKIEYVGICGSDSHYLESGAIGDFVVEGDFILGHECAGEVVKLGSKVTDLEVGDKVALEPGITCGECEFCKTGKYNLCPDVEFLATPPYHGCLVNYLAFPANMCFKLPSNITSKEGALVEPLAVGMHAAEQGKVTLGDSVIILGAGCIGLVTLLACKAYGATDITVVDVMQKRLDFATALGASRVINASEEDPVKVMDKITNGRGLDVVIETAGSKVTIKQTSYLVKSGGTIVLVGMAPEDIVDYNFAKIMAKEATITSVFRYRNIYKKAIDAISKGIIDVSGIVTHEFDFEDTAKAFEYVSKNKNDVVKAVIKVG
ncbi:MAG: NAD(P)-dependent alcohol dehydrogenase [Clostridiales bacterium]|jgi:L-iditol 2-dehydrogenase|nr:NAD(P)-dependent alcohol dehydrogenase [Clostridiales bacterium]